MDAGIAISVGALLVSGGVSWGVAKATYAVHTKEIQEMKNELIKARQLANDLRTALVGINGDNGIASEVRQQRKVAEQNNVMIHELKMQIALLSDRRSGPR